MEINHELRRAATRSEMENDELELGHEFFFFFLSLLLFGVHLVVDCTNLSGGLGSQMTAGTGAMFLECVSQN